MFRLHKKVSTVVLSGLIALAFAGSAFAASESEKSVTGFFKRLFGYPAKATQKTGEMTANTLHNTGEKVVAKTGENTAEVLTGNVQEAGNLVAEPVVGTLETTGQAVSETAQIPVAAAQEETTAVQ